MRSRLEGVSNVVAALRAGIGTVGMSSECSALLALSAPLADALTSETGAVADSAALRAAASQGSRLPAASKSSRGLLIDTNIGHTPHFSWLPSLRGAPIESMEHLNTADIKPRLSDSIRDRKNFMIILNTICRKAAQTAYIHPVHLDEISRKFAIKIEDCTSIAQLEVLENEITRKYCLLVQSYSLRTYSKPIQNIINYISFNLTADLSLNALSEEFLLNSSYLSTLFKKETGVTLTNFVNTKRIEHAIYLLNTTQSAIQDIAAQCGINDANYFTKLFKKLKNMTPTQYREMVQHK